MPWGRMNWTDALQWPAMATTVIAAWLIGSRSPEQRYAGFLCFLLSNLLWVLWGWSAKAWALILLQLCLVLMNIHGLRENTPHRNGRPF